MPTSHEFAVMQFTRFRPVRRRAGGVRFTRLRRKAKHHLFSAISLPKALLPPDSIVLLQLRRIRNTYRKTNVPQTLQSGGCENASSFLGSAARRGKGISDSAAADVIASHAPLRKRRHKARQNGPKHYPGGFKGIAIPLTRLSPLSFAVQRKMESPKGTGNAERQVKTYSERYRHRRSSRKENAGKHVKITI